ncbi:MAG TPA: DUF1573 domain-containing protein [Ferruginibacter sp.]|mgnify:CR=1 FL=1|jgi:hypothetical protein|nr:DUF1573 domain-containing protein [Ferruginibacter sp.]MBN8701370.1 DUF1573 domain-containing protein [Chitinophagales bacterium]HMX36009.1 DUF1573 domain-containing protein [Ferruginibacter sp.]HMX81183.1 DUF1573 domain-containing protein [Ferruginibacter sp.]HNF01690.1 DUF1573 domain-containing protein [Ferruginibacter sp.]
MKKLLLLATAFTLGTSLFAQKKVADVAKFDTETINQGNLKLNEPKEVKFIVTNISNEPLIIEQASPTCGCTIGDYTKSPIAPGATGFISAKFNAASVGHFDKHLTVKFAGVDETKSITITGDVLEPAAYEKWAAEMNDAKKKTDAPAQPAKSNKTAGKSSSSKSNG